MTSQEMELNQERNFTKTCLPITRQAECLYTAEPPYSDITKTCFLLQDYRLGA